MFYQNKERKAVAVFALALILLTLFPAKVALADDPTVSVAAPSNEIGDVGAALGNVWNMDSLSDVTWTQPNASGQTINYQLIPSGVSGAYGSVLRGETPEGSDLVTAFYTNASVSIPTDVYHHLLYRLYVPHHQPSEGGVEFTNGRILYSSVWSSNWYIALDYRRYSDPYALCGYGTWCLYYVDLANSSLNGPGSPNPWDWGQSGARAEAFGLWPHENWAKSFSDLSPSGDTPEYFYLDYVYLTGDIVAKSPDYTYSVRWNVGDPDGGLITSTLYYQEMNELQLPSQRPTCDSGLSGWTQIAGSTQSITVSPSGSYAYTLYLPILLRGGASFGSGEIGPFNQSYTWDLSSLDNGKTYYICVEVEDSNGNKSYGVSSAPVIKVPPADLP